MLYLKKQMFKINDAIFYLKKPGKVKQIKIIVSKGNKIENKEKKITKAKSWLFEKINKMYKPLVRLIKEKREHNLPQSEFNKGNIITDSADTYRIREY